MKVSDTARKIFEIALAPIMPTCEKDAMTAKEIAEKLGIESHLDVIGILSHIPNVAVTMAIRHYINDGIMTRKHWVGYYLEK